MIRILDIMIERYIYSPPFISIFKEDMHAKPILDKNLDCSFDNLRDAMIFKLSQGKKCVIVVSDEDYDKVKNYFRAMNFPIFEFRGIKELAFTEEALQANISSSDELEFDLIYKSIAAYYKGLYNPNINGKSLFQIINRESPYIIQKEIDAEGLFEFSDGEYADLLDQVTRASRLYDHEYSNVNKTQKGFTLNQIVLPKDLAIEDLLSVYTDDYNTIYELRGRYLKALSEEKKGLRDNSKIKYDLLEEQLINLKLIFHKFTTQYGSEKVEKPSIFSFDKFLKERYEAWLTAKAMTEASIVKFNSYNYDFTLSAEVNSLEDLTYMVGLLESKYQNWWDESEKEIAETIKRINHINEFNPNFLSLYKALIDEIKGFNERKVYSLIFECNARSTLKQVEFLDQVISYLSSEIKDLERIPRYNNWLHFVENSTQAFQKLLKQIVAFDKEEWVEIFCYNYEKSLIETKKAAYVYFNKAKLERYWNIYTKLNTSLIEQLTLDYNLGIQKCQEIIKTENTRLYKQWQKSKVISTPEFKDIHDPYQYINSMLVPVSDVAKIGSSEKTVFLIGENNYATKFDFQFLADSNLDKRDTSKLNYLHKFYEEKIDDINITERIRSAKQLALSLLDLNENIRIFQSSFSNIICIDDGYIANCVLKAWQNSGIKEFRVGHDLENGLIESIIMTDRPQFLIFSNGLLSNEKIEYLPWQLQVIHAYQTAGFNLLPIWTYETMDLDNIVNLIKAKTKPEP